MLDTKDFSFIENQNNVDFKGFLIKTLSYWKWFLLSWVIAFTIAYQVNVRKEKIYSIQTTLSIKEESNPFFTSNTSLVFNWGGTSDEVQTIATTLRSRSHNELVVDKLQFYINYLKQAKYNITDAYGEVPFYVNINKVKGQLYGQLIKIKFLDEKTYKIIIPFENDKADVVHYIDNSISQTSVAKDVVFEQTFQVGEQVNLPFLNWKLELNPNPGFYKNNEYFVSFAGFDATVSNYQNVNIEPDAKGGSILKLSLEGTNKARMVKYLNTTVEVLKNNQLAMKNQFATNTIAFIDSTLLSIEKELKNTNEELKDFRKDKNIFEVEGEGTKISENLLDYDVQKDAISRKLAYYTSLNNYLVKSVDFSKLPAPSVAGIDDPNIVIGVSKLISLSAQRSELKYAVKSDKIFRDFDNQMEAIKKVLLVNIVQAKAAQQYDLNLISAKIAQTQNTIKQLPEDKQALLKIKRKYDLNDNIYSTFLSKKSEADIVKAANLSDIHFIDPAKDTGEGLVGPKTGINYILALFLGFLIPLLFVLGIFFVNNAIQNTDDINKLTKIPIIGVVGKKQFASNLAVFDKPKSALSEAFRSIRSSLQFLYKKQNVAGAKTLMITSSISGEGKTFCSINLATVFSLSEKKTVIVGLDLRKPKIFENFNLSNEVGVVNFLIGQKSVDQIIQKTPVPFLDVITSGPVPPNPAELLMGDAMKELLSELKTKYDYIILDTPPLGLVADALELAEFCDVVLYIVRQNFTKKEMITLLNNRVKREELKNVSIIFNGFENKAKYGYGYGYGNYSSDYHEDDQKKSIISKLYTQFFKK